MLGLAAVNAACALSAAGTARDSGVADSTEVTDAPEPDGTIGMDAGRDADTGSPDAFDAAQDSTVDATSDAPPDGDAADGADGATDADAADAHDVGPTYSIGGTVSGAGGSLVLVDNGTDMLTVAQNGSFTFADPLATGATYQVTVGQSPVGQLCSVAQGSGTVGSADVTDVPVDLLGFSQQPLTLPEVSVLVPHGLRHGVEECVRQRRPIVQAACYVYSCPAQIETLPEASGTPEEIVDLSPKGEEETLRSIVESCA